MRHTGSAVRQKLRSPRFCRTELATAVGYCLRPRGSNHPNGRLEFAWSERIGAQHTTERYAKLPPRRGCFSAAAMRSAQHDWRGSLAPTDILWGSKPPFATREWKP